MQAPSRIKHLILHIRRNYEKGVATNHMSLVEEAVWRNSCLSTLRKGTDGWL